MVAPIRFLSGRQQQQKIGIEGSTENQKVLEVIGQVGIGTTIFEPSEQLDVRGSVSVADTITASIINATTVVVTGSGNTFSDLTVTGIATFSSDIDANGGLDVDGHTELDNVNISGVSTFAGAIDANGDLDVDGFAELDAVNISQTLSVTGISTFSSDVDINDGLDVDGHTELDDLNVSGVSTFTGTADFNGNVDIDGHTELDDLNVSGVSTFTSAVDINASIDVDGHTELDDLNVSGVSTFTGAIDANGNLDVDGHTELDDLNVSGVSTFTGAADFNGNVDIDGHTELDDLNVSGVSTFTGAIDANGDLDVDGHTELDDLNVSGVSTFTSAVDINASIDVDGHTELDDLNVSGVSTFTSAVDINASIDVDGHTELDDLNVSGVSTFTGAIDANGDLDVDGHTELDDLNVSGVSTFTGVIDANGNLDVDGHTELDDLNVSGVSTLSNVFISGKLGIGTDATPTGKLEVLGGDAYFRENVNIYKDLTIYGNVSVAGTTVTLQGETVVIEDRDLILGFTTSQTPNDTTANHGGIAIASTEGSPLIPLYIAGINTLPDTYKQFMWVKSGTYSGLATDTWISNYAVSIGSTELESGIGLGVGTAVRIYNSGIISATAYYGSGGNLEDIIKEKIEGFTAQLVDSVGTATTLGDVLRVTDLTINNENATVGYITAVGFGSTAIYYFNDPIARGLTTDASINTTGIVTFQSDVNVGYGATLTLFDISTGRVGINSTTPEKTLDVIGDVKLAGKLYDHTVSAGSTDYVITSNGETSEWEWKAISSLGVAANIDVQEIGASDTRYLSGVTGIGLTTKVFIDTNNPVVINGSGNLGVGTDSPQTTLHVVDEFLLTTAGAASSQRITQRAYTTDNGTLSWEGSAGQLFSVTNNLTSGSIFSVNDVSGIPSIDVDADGTIQLAPFGATEYVGVGLTNPTQKLDVNGDARLRGALYDFNNATGNPGELLTTTGAGVSWSTATTTPSGRSVTNIASSTPYYITASETNSGVSTAAYIDSIIFIKDGNLGIGTDNPTTKLDVDGGVIVSGVVTATDFNSTSDARLKTNVQVIEDPLEKVLQINGVSFNWIKDNRPSMGVIADNIQEVLPELVSDTDPKTVNYNGLIGLLIECVKHQQEEINALKASINNNN